MSDFNSQFGVFYLGELKLGLPLAELKEVIPYRDIQPFAIPAPYICGGIDLRGTLIPLIDIGPMVGASAGASGEKIVVVVSFQEAVVGLLADRLDGVRDSQPSERTMYDIGGGSPALIPQSFPDTDKRTYINVVSAEAIFRLPGIPRVIPAQVDAPSSLARQSASMGHLMLMRVGDMLVAVEPTSVFATVLISDLQAPVVDSDFYIGDLRYDGNKIPVVSMLELLGQKRQPEKEREAFLIRYPDGVVAFAIDQVISVVPLPYPVENAIPSDTVPNQRLLAGVIPASELAVEETGYFLVLNSAAMIVEQALSDIARLTLKHRETPREQAANGTDSQERQDGCPMLVFDAGQYWATEIQNISEVLPLQQQINIFSQDGFAQGLVFSRGKPIPVYCLSRVVHSPPPESLTPTSSVLVIDVGEVRIGFMVTSLIGVETRIWQKNEYAPMSFAAGPGGSVRVGEVRSVARLRSEQGPRTVQTLDLLKLATALVPAVVLTPENSEVRTVAGE